MAPQMRQLLLITSVDVHRHDFRRRAVFGKSPPTDATSIRAEERTAVIAWSCRQTPDVRPVGLHHVDFICPRWIGFEGRLLLSSQILLVSRSIRSKRNPRSVRRP